MYEMQKIITVTLNPAIDRVIEVSGLQLGGHEQVRTTGSSPGGKGVNVSRTLAAMGLASTAMGLLGQDNRELFETIFDDGLICDAFLNLPGLTRENITLRDIQTGLDTHLRDTGLAVRRADVREFVEQLGATVEPGDVVVFSGSLPGGVTCDDFAEMLKTADQTGARVAVDSSGPALQTAGKAKLKNFWLIKPNLAELSELVGRELATIDEQLSAARGLAQKVEFVLLSAGADGAYLVTRENVSHASVQLGCETVKNTVGCGDVLLGTFLGAVWEGNPPEAALGQAVAAAGACAANETAAKFDQATFEKLAENVKLEEF